MWAVLLTLALFVASSESYARPRYASGQDVAIRRAAYQELVTKEARKNGLDARVLAAIITVESNWHPSAMHVEAHYRYVLNLALHARESGVSIDTERHLQRVAWGLTQLVGGTARSIGFRGPLSGLLDPATNVHWGARYLGGLNRRYRNVWDCVAAYNAGSVRRNLKTGRYSNQSYVDKIAVQLRHR